VLEVVALLLLWEKIFVVQNNMGITVMDVENLDCKYGKG
jgi:hypothetical protein